MKIVGLITEYNPFHNGHQYHLEQAKEISGADEAVVIMSGDYVQRGTPAIMPKSLRTEMALAAGAAAVFELPFPYATGSAELFAHGAVSFLHALGCVVSLVFGSEHGDIEKLDTLADILNKEPAAFQHYLQENLKQGVSFPRARAEALEKYLNHLKNAKQIESDETINNSNHIKEVDSFNSQTVEKINLFEIQDYVTLMKEPNNILGIEYLKALKKLNSPMKAYCLKRQGAHYHEKEIKPAFSSATAIRSLLAYTGNVYSTFGDEKKERENKKNKEEHNKGLSTILRALKGQVPESCLDILVDNHGLNYPVYQKDFSLLLKYKLLEKSPGELNLYQDVSLELANKIHNQLNHFLNTKQFSQLLKSKDITQTRINRALLHILLGLKKTDLTEYCQNGYHFYGRLLGFQKGKDALISHLHKNSDIPIITKTNPERNLHPLGQQMLAQETLASNLYQSVITNKFKKPFENEYSRGVIKL